MPGKALRIGLGLGMSLLAVGCCWYERMAGTLTSAEDGRGRVHDNVHGVTFAWAYPKCLPSWSWHAQGFKIAIGVEDWHWSGPDGSGGPFLSSSPLFTLSNVLVVWVAINPDGRTRLSLDPTRMRISARGSPDGSAPICVVPGKKWEGGMQCDPSRPDIVGSVLSAYRARFKSASTRDEALMRCSVAEKFSAYLISRSRLEAKLR